MTGLILNSGIAARACGAPAEKMIVSPAFRGKRVPRNPDLTLPNEDRYECIKGRVLPGSPSFSSNEEMVTLPLWRRMTIWLATVPPGIVHEVRGIHDGSFLVPRAFYPVMHQVPAGIFAIALTPGS